MRGRGDDSRLDEAFRLFDRAHAEDSVTVRVAGESVPRAVRYHLRMTHWLERLAPDAGEALRLAARSQHIRRWAIPRDRYPAGKVGYKQWRRDLAEFHASEAAEVLHACGYGEDVVGRVQELFRKKGLKTDPEARTLEDVVCLVFLETEFAAFAARHDEEKIKSILRKTWAKMTERGRSEALGLVASWPEDSRPAALVKSALSE